MESQGDASSVEDYTYNKYNQLVQVEKSAGTDAAYTYYETGLRAA